MPNHNFKPELVETSTKEFERHLKLPNNDKIIFSGRFGLGKTTFLDYYFSERSEEFYSIRLAPVNYSVASNEDIFKYIKYDVLRTLISDEFVTLKEQNFSKWENLPFFLSNNYRDILRGIFRAISKLGPSKQMGIDGIYQELEVLYDKLEAVQEKSNNGESKQASNFMSFLQDEEGSLYEYNLITEIISSGLEQAVILEGNSNVNEKEIARKKVLIIDDLDRIDPAHIFRLFNVFAAHTDFNGDEGDKFGFDHVIFVCDIDNIRSIFHHKYGGDTDFSGYIDKFYSHRVFRFENKNDIRRTLEKYVGSIDFASSPYLANEGLAKRIVADLLYIMETFRLNNLYNLRNLNFEYFEYEINNVEISFQNGRENSNTFVSVNVIRILINIFGDRITLKQHLESCINEEDTLDQLKKARFSNVIMFILYDQFDSKTNSFLLSNHKLSFVIERDRMSDIRYCMLENKYDVRALLLENSELKKELNFFKLYGDCLDLLGEKGIC